MNRRAWTIVMLLLAVCCTVSALPGRAAEPAPTQEEPVSLPKYLTPAERLLPPLSIQRGTPPSGTVRCPAEYEACAGLFLAWEGYTDLLTQMTVLITNNDPEAVVYMVVDTTSEQTSVVSTLTSAGANLSQVEFIVRVTDTVWIRDYGPRFILEDGQRAIVDHTYNRPRPNDNALNDYIAALWGIPQYDIPLTHGGGNFHLFSNGDAFMTSLILTENPGHTADSVKALYAAYQGVDLTIYPGFPTSFDSTQHIDMWMLPVGDDQIIIGQYSASDGQPYTITENAVADLTARGYTVYRTPGWRSGGTHYTYTNAVILNDQVFMSKFNHANDAVALAVFQAAMPDKVIHQLDCSSIIQAAGALHCIVMHVPADRALTISLPDGTPEFLAPGQPTAITIQISPGAESYVPESGTLHYCYDGENWLTAPLTALVNELYEAVLPPAGCDDTPAFYFSATGDQGTVITNPADAPATLYTATVATVTVHFADDFESDLGWTVVSDPSLTGGEWERGVPVNCNRGDPPTDYDGSGQCCLTENNPLTCNSDVDWGPTYLTSPVIDLSTAADPILSYARWFTCDDAGSYPADEDFLDVEVSTDDGATWTLIESAAQADGWVLAEFRLADFVTPSAQTRIRFTANDTPNNSITEAAVDALRIYELSCSLFGPGDMNCDGLVNAFDIDPFVLALTDSAAYAAQYPDCNYLNGDINGDGLVNAFDIDPFVLLLTGR